MAGISDAPFIRGLAVPSVCLLIAFLGYGSQLVLHRSTTLDPGPPSRAESILAPHHCRFCGHCVPKMDHHCPWTRNCVSMTTFPHFLRFLVYANVSLWMLAYLLWQRFAVLWTNRLMPAYLGPSLAGLIAISVLALVNFFTSLALGIMLVSTLKNCIFNQTMIEGWEMERHEAVVDRAGRDWWDVVGPNGDKVRCERLEFPYDIGFFANMAQAMGTRNPLLWLWPLAGNPTVGPGGAGPGWSWEENGFNRVEGLWPPVDPDKIRRGNRDWPAARRDYAEELRVANLDTEEHKAEFRKRQAADERRKRHLLAELEEIDDYEIYESSKLSDRDLDDQPGWTNSEGDRLVDYGVDEDEDVPLAELIRRRKVTTKRDPEDE